MVFTSCSQVRQRGHLPRHSRPAQAAGGRHYQHRCALYPPRSCGLDHANPHTDVSLYKDGTRRDHAMTHARLTFLSCRVPRRPQRNLPCRARRRRFSAAHAHSAQMPRRVDQDLQARRALPRPRQGNVRTVPILSAPNGTAREDHSLTHAPATRIQ